MKKLRVYIDNSVVGGCFDEEFAEASNALFKMAQEGKLTLIVSDILALEAVKGPDNVPGKLQSLAGEAIERASVNRCGKSIRRLSPPLTSRPVPRS